MERGGTHGGFDLGFRGGSGGRVALGEGEMGESSCCEETYEEELGRHVERWVVWNLRSFTGVQIQTIGKLESDEKRWLNDESILEN